jgi:hypothetical protein
MRNLSKVSIVLAIASFVACKPSISPEQKQQDNYPMDTIGFVQEFSTTEDTVIEDLTSPSIKIEIYDNHIKVESGNVNTTFEDVDLSRILLRRSESGLISYLQVNNSILFQESKQHDTRHSYLYITDNIIKIQKGNTIDGIIADHPDMVLSRKSLTNCNQFLHRGLQVGDLVKLKCN